MLKKPTYACHQLGFSAFCFTRYNDTNVRGGFNQPLITSEDPCKSACLSNQSCAGVDWNNVNSGCWFATNATDPTKYNQTGITHYDLNRTCSAGKQMTILLYCIVSIHSRSAHQSESLPVREILR